MSTEGGQQQVLSELHDIKGMVRKDLETDQRVGKVADALPFTMVAQEAAMVVRTLGLPITFLTNFMVRTRALTWAFYRWVWRRLFGGGKGNRAESATQAPARPFDARAGGEVVSAPGPAIDTPAVPAATSRAVTIGQAASGLGRLSLSLGLVGGALVALAGLPMLFPGVAVLGLAGVALMGTGAVVTRRAARGARIAAPPAQPVPVETTGTRVALDAVGKDVARPAPHVPPVGLEPAKEEVTPDNVEPDVVE